MPHLHPAATEAENAGAAAYQAGHASSTNPHGDPDKAGRNYLNARAWAMGWEAAATADLVLRSTTDLDLLAEVSRDRALAADYESRARVAAARLEEVRAAGIDKQSRNRNGAYTRLSRVYAEKAATYQASADRIQAEIDRRARRRWDEFSDAEIVREIHVEKAFMQIDHPARRRGHLSLVIQLEEIQHYRRQVAEQQQITAAAARFRRGTIAANLDIGADYPGIIYQAAEGEAVRIDVLRVEPDAAGIDQLQPAGQATATKTPDGWKITE